MSQGDLNQIEQAAGRLSPSEKRELIRRLDVSLEQSSSHAAEHAVVASQSAAWRTLRNQLEFLPVNNPDDRRSGADHDGIIVEST